MVGIIESMKRGWNDERISYIWPEDADYKLAPSSLRIEGVGKLRMLHTKTVLGDDKLHEVRDGYARKPMMLVAQPERLPAAPAPGSTRLKPTPPQQAIALALPPTTRPPAGLIIACMFGSALITTSGFLMGCWPGALAFIFGTALLWVGGALCLAGLRAFNLLAVIDHYNA